MESDTNNSLEQQGLLDLTVELSTSDITAGNEFAIFVLVKNPFSKPVWVREVNVSLPSELKRVDEEKIQEKMREAEDKQQKMFEESKQERIKLQEKTDSLQTQISELTQALNSDGQVNQVELSRLISTFEYDLKRFQDRLKSINVGMSIVQVFSGAEVDKLKVSSQASEVQIFSVDEDSLERKPTRVKQIEIYEPWLVYEQQSQARTVKLKSSLPENVALQPGSTAVYTVVLNVKRSLIFTPAKYRLQFYVNYGFNPEQTEENKIYSPNENLSTNTIAHSLSIRPSVYAVIVGSIIGGTIGACARLLQTPTPLTIQNSVVSLVLSVILGGMAVIFMARKSDTQSFVSVEDFWGGILIGFLVGYTGTSFFEGITGISTPQP